jgi:hypothetical protein
MTLIQQPTSSFSRKRILKKIIPQTSKPKKNGTIEDLFQSRSIKGDGRLNFRKVINVRRYRCCVFLGRSFWRTNKEEIIPKEKIQDGRICGKANGY